MELLKLCLVAATLVPSLGTAATLKNETFFNKQVCSVLKGNPNHRIYIDGSYILPDCLTSTTAYEGDWGYKAWKEGVGQAIVYGVLTDKDPHILVYIRTEDPALMKKDMHGLKILETVDPVPHTVIYTNRSTGEWSVAEQESQ